MKQRREKKKQYQDQMMELNERKTRRWLVQKGKSNLLKFKDK